MEIKTKITHQNKIKLLLKKNHSIEKACKKFEAIRLSPKPIIFNIYQMSSSLKVEEVFIQEQFHV